LKSAASWNSRRRKGGCFVGPCSSREYKTVVFVRKRRGTLPGGTAHGGGMFGSRRRELQVVMSLWMLYVYRGSNVAVRKMTLRTNLLLETGGKKKRRESWEREDLAKET